MSKPSTGKYIVVYFLFCFLIVSWKHSFAQEYYFSSLSVNEGLSSSVVSVIYQDHKGFMWIGTDEGLNKYDGYQFTTYRNEKEDSLSLSNNLIRYIFEDKKNRLWVSTFNGIGYFDEQRLRYHRIIDDVIGNEIFELPDGNILASGDAGIRIIDSETYELIELSTTSNHGLPSNQIIDIVLDKYGNVQLIFSDGIARLDYENIKIVDYQKFDGIDESKPIRTAVVDDSKNIWLASDDELMIYDAQVRQITLTVPFNSTSDPGKSRIVNDICATSDSKIWIGTQRGIYIYNIITGDFKYLFKGQNRNSITNNEVFYIYQDRDENFWVGTYGGGINFASVYDNNFLHYSLKFNQSDNPGNIIVSDFEEASSGKIYIATWGDGIKYFDPETNQHFDLPIGDQSKFDDEIFRAITLDENEDILWAASRTNGLFKINVKTGNYEHFTHDPKEKQSITTNILYTIYKTKNGEIWIGHQSGVDILNPKQNTFRRRNDIKGQDGKDLHYIRSITEDSKGNIYLGSHDDGLLILNQVTGESKHLITENSALNNDIIYALHIIEGNLYIGKMHGGLTVMNMSNYQMVNITSEHGLPNDCINGIAHDLSEQIWLSTNNGISKFNISFLSQDQFPTQEFVDQNLKPENFTNFNMSDGLQNNEFKYGAYYQNENYIFFGGINGYNKFQPQKIIENPIVPELVFTDVKVFSNDTWENGEIPEIETDDEGIPTILLNHTHNLLTIDYAALSFIRSEKNQYAYYMENFDNGWRYVGDERRASYTNLPSGEFTFRVKASNNSNVWNEEGILMKIKVVPPFWATVWFQFIMLTSLLVCLYIYYRYRLRSINERNRELEAAVEKRTSELKSVNESLNSKKEEIEQMWEKIHQADIAQLEFFTNISHEIRTPLTLIAGPLEEIHKKENFKESTKKLISIIDRNTKRLLRLVNELLDFRAIQHKGIKLYFKQIEIVNFIRAIIDNYEFMAENKGVEIQFISHDSDLLIWLDPEKIEKVFYNVIGNALKFTNDDGIIRITIDYNKDEEKCIIEIRDNGVGIPEDKIENIFDRYYQYKGKVTGIGSGIGLTLSREIIQMHQGFMDIKSEEGFGTTVKIELRTDDAHIKEHEVSEDNNYNLIQNYNILEEKAIESVNTKLTPEILTKDQTVILLVEDDDELRAYMNRILSQYHIIMEAKDGIQAEKIAYEYIPDIIITDVVMPKQDGIQLIMNLRDNEKTSHIPVIIVSAKGNDQDLLTGFKSGIMDYLIKPFNSQILLLKISNILEQRKLLQQRIKEHPFELSVIRTNPEDVQFYKKVQRIIEENIGDEDFNTETLAQLLNMSRSQLYRKLSAISDTSASELIKDIRMNKAKERLLHSNDSITSIAYQLGFKNTSHFTKSFSAKYGEPPSKFRSSESIS